MGSLTHSLSKAETRAVLAFMVSVLFTAICVCEVMWEPSLRQQVLQVATNVIMVVLAFYFADRRRNVQAGGEG